MSIYDFSFGDVQDQKEKFISPPNEPDRLLGYEKPVDDVVNPNNYDIRDEDDSCCKEDCKYDQIDDNFVERVREFSEPGFKLMDKGIKNYFSGIRVPIASGNEEYRIMGVRIAGADRTSLIYADKYLLNGRLILPILSISRTGETFDPKRYSPPILPFHKQYINNGCKVKMLYRPVPYLIDYTLDILAEHKSDVEYALYFINSRFNPIVSYLLEDSHYDMAMEVILHFKGSADYTELEADPDTHIEYKHSITVQMEGWLPLPSKIIPTVLARPVFIEEGIAGTGNTIVSAGETYDLIRDQMK